ncbi:uracil-xanthine permease [Colidextribacter sp. OB.20]|uniref:uracil-xanthine permease family protein n=1 Tax=Colidextribacter sp. OB.20 TaxID=2304568 RepID=UPI0013701324|nr:uracil-xanthine permease family protein [Colidextribacter sp. OB.20]NBI11242.1 uracil-xanthine permease [Colidextribacter sp. OB.20]
MNNNQPIRDARQLGLPKMLILGLQHMFAMFGATVLVPILVNGYGLPLSIQTTLFFAGIGTLFFHVCTRMKVPAFLGSSFAYLGGFAAVAELDSGIYAGMSGEEKLPYALGGIVVAGLLYLALAGLIKAVGVHKVMRFLPPVVTGPIIILIGLSLAPSAINNASTNWWLAVLAMAVIVAANIWGRGMIKIIPILLGVLVPYAVALVTNQVDFSTVAAAKAVGIQPFVLAKFDLTAILVMAPIALAAMMEHIGDMSAISATVEENFIEDPGLHRTLIGDGVATSLAGLFGGPANTTYGENTGVLELSQVFDPKVVRLAAVYAVILSFSPKFAAVINSIPTAIIGGVSFILYGMISAIGVRNVVENRVDFTNSRNLIIAAVIMVCGLGFKIWGFGNEFSGLTFHVGGTDITLTSLAIAAIAGIALNAILPGKDYQFGSDVTQGRSGDFGRY